MDSNGTVTLTPTRRRERIQSLDVLRGFALLGILVMNIQLFSMIEAAYFNPTAYGDLSGPNLWVWILSHSLADQKFMTLFSILFGAGVVLMSSRVESRGASAAPVHYRRTLGLLLFGIIHAYCFWYGDILVWYSLCSLVVFLFRRKSPRTLVTLGLLSVLVPSLLYVLFGLGIQHMPEEGRQEFLQDWRPSEEAVEEEVRIYRSGWVAQMEHRVPQALVMHSLVFLVWAGWRAGGLMLVGMALFKWGILSAHRSVRFYVTMSVLGLGLGWPLVGYGISRNFAEGWSLEFSRFTGYQFNYWGSLLVSMGYLGLVMLICKAGAVAWLLDALASVGRLALTNYLLQTLICTSLFYGHGLGLFGSVERIGQIGIVAAIWVVQLIASSLWLRRFQLGPFEWLWRSMTYRRWQPLVSSGANLAAENP